LIYLVNQAQTSGVKDGGSFCENRVYEGDIFPNNYSKDMIGFFIQLSKKDVKYDG
jgi:hypothetical protein